MRQENKYLVFTVSNSKFAVDISNIERIVDYSSITKVPESDSYVEGIIKNEDCIYSIINLSKKFMISNVDDKDINNTDINKKIIIARNEKFKFGILTDKVEEIILASEEEIELPSNIIMDGSRSYISGLIKKDNEIIILIDLSKIIESL